MILFAKRIGDAAQIIKVAFPSIMILFAGQIGNRIEQNMVVDMFGVGVGGDKHLVLITKYSFCKLYTDFMGGLGVCLSGLEALDHMVGQYAAGLAVLLLDPVHSLNGKPGIVGRVDPRDIPLVFCLCRVAYVLYGAVQTDVNIYDLDCGYGVPPLSFSGPVTACSISASFSKCICAISLYFHAST